MNILRCPSSNIPNELECINSLVDLHSHPSKAQLPRWPERYPYLCADNVKGTAAFYHLKSERTCQKEITFIIIIHFIFNLFPLISTRDARQLLWKRLSTFTKEAEQSIHSYSMSRRIQKFSVSSPIPRSAACFVVWMESAVPVPVESLTIPNSERDSSRIRGVAAEPLLFTDLLCTSPCVL